MARFYFDIRVFREMIPVWCVIFFEDTPRLAVSKDSARSACSLTADGGIGLACFLRRLFIPRPFAAR